MPAHRRRVVYQGRVQGVGFRATAWRLASGFVVSGFVRNLPDGGVELVAEGDPEQVAGLLAAIRREFAEKIRDEDASDLPTIDEGRPGRFDIRH